MIHLAIFASGNGTNAERIMNEFEVDQEITVSAVFSNRADAYVLKRAENFGVPTEVFDRSQFSNPGFSRRLDNHQVDFIVLAGFLWKIPEHLIRAFPKKILNIHPALLPSYGGKGMYGERVHQAVLMNNEQKSGITIHLVNENYDEGRILFQAECEVANDTVMSLAEKIHRLEHLHFPRVIRNYVMRSS